MNLEIPHRRLNPLTGEWVLVSPQRTQRPWLGQVEKAPQEVLQGYDPNCYLCPGNRRNSGEINPVYMGTYVFDNDFAALIPPGPERPQELPENDLYITQFEPGICRVVCFSPRHDLSLAELPPEDVVRVAKTWIAQTKELAEKDFIHYVQVFENKGAMMGASNPHPHSQIWATAHIPNEPSKELSNQTNYEKQHQRCLLCDCLIQERDQRTRMVVENDSLYGHCSFLGYLAF